MNNLRQAAEQALEVLEWSQPHADASITYEEAIDALRAALAEEALQRLTDVQQDIEAALAEPNKCTHGVTDGNCKECYMAEPEQEPIGYLWPTGRHPEFRFTQQKRDGVDGMPVYTAPPQRKPLTDEEIHDCFQQRSRDKTKERKLITRAIEAAHGIGEKK